MISYRKLFALLAIKGMKKTDLLQIISSPTLAKLSKGEIVKTDIIEKICLFLYCQPSDIMEILQEEELEDTKTGKKAKLIIKDTINEEYEHAEIRETYIQLRENDEPHLLERSDKN